MKKVRIAIWGISDGIWNAVQNELNPQNVEIVLFFDNDEMKRGVCYRDIPIVAPTKQLVWEYKIDYILVAALSAYESIREQLIHMGIEKEKIQAFIAKDITKYYCIGKIDDIDINLIKKIYFEPQEIMNIVAEYKKVFDLYSKIPACEESVEEWYTKGRMISHACGGIVNGKRMMGSNSKEAFGYSAEKNFKLIECDLTRLYNGELVLLHDWGRFWEWGGQYSPMTAKELLTLIKEHREMNCLIDIKWKDHDEYNLLINEIDKLIKAICTNSSERDALKRQVIMEVYDEETIQIAKENNFDMIFTQYRNSKWQCFMNTVNLCYQYGIKVIALPVYACLELRKFIKIFTDKNIKIFAYSTDSIEEYSELRRMNVTGIFTNYLTESDIG